MSEQYKVLSGNQSFDLIFEDSQKTKGTINGKSFDIDVVKISEHTYHLIKDHVSYTINIVKIDPLEKTATLQINGKKYTFAIKDKMALLLESMGFDISSSTSIRDLKSPMPGLVLDILVEENQEVKKGDPLLILEAMKMENIIKSAGDGKVKKILVKKGKAVEKSELLIQFT